jgi:hypothetical protein
MHVVGWALFDSREDYQEQLAREGERLFAIKR